MTPICFRYPQLHHDTRQTPEMKALEYPVDNTKGITLARVSFESRDGLKDWYYTVELCIGHDVVYKTSGGTNIFELLRYYKVPAYQFCADDKFREDLFNKLFVKYINSPACDQRRFIDLPF